MSDAEDGPGAQSRRNQPLDMVALSLDLPVIVKLRGDRELEGRLHAFDGHCNLVLGDVTERVYEADDDEDSDEEGARGVNVVEKKSEMLFVRGDSVVMISRKER